MAGAEGAKDRRAKAGDGEVEQFRVEEHGAGEIDD
jgi:hypothetical protein